MVPVIGLRPPANDDSHPELLGLVRDEIASQGRITFARFMELVVAHPEFGYYATSRSRAGRTGDFLTAPETHPIFGSVVARQLLEMWGLLGKPEEFTIREFGAGRGTLARQVLAAISASGLQGLSTVRYQLIDLGEDAPEDDPALPARFEGVVLGNEFLDALPFHRLAVRDGELQEIYTTIRDGWFADEIGPLSADLETHLPADVKLVEGQKVEISPARDAWLRAIGARLARGFVILIDYGYPRPDIYDPARFPEGSLKTYRAHEVAEDPYQHLGRQDITAHVDFTAIERSATTAGIDVLGLTTQAEFVSGLGIDRDLLDVQRDATSPEEYLAARTAVMALLDPMGLGRFRVLMLSRGIEPPGVLGGLSFSLRDARM